MSALATSTPTLNKPLILGTPGMPKMEMPVIKQWFADKGDQTLRLDYPLNASSVVLDLGGYEGNWAAQIADRYGCTIHVFEPVPDFAAKIEQRFVGRPNIRVHPVGVADETGTQTLYIDRDSTSLHKSKGTPCEIALKSAREVFAELGLNKTGVDLMKINIEGCEFELLQHLIDTGLIHKIRDIQVQFHDFVPDASARMEDLQRQLQKTHDLSWQYRFVWENWHRQASR